MRKLHLLFLILFLVSPVAGCRQNSSSSTDIPEGETVRAVSALNAFAFDMTAAWRPLIRGISS